MPEQSVTAASSTLQVPQIIGRLGLSATYAAAALLLVAICGDLDVLAFYAPLVGWLALLVGTLPLVALLLSTLASYINYYGVWRVLRGKDEYDAGDDLKSHAADVPQAVQSLLAGRAGCVPAASTVALCLSLVLAVATSLPPQTPFIGELGTWQDHLGELAVVSARATPTPTSALAPTATATTPVRSTPAPPAKPTATPKPTARPTATPAPRPRPTSTPVINFAISPAAATWMCTTQGFNPVETITLNNRGSNVPVTWQATAIETVTGANGLPQPWATLSPTSISTVAASGTQSLTITAVPTLVCNASLPSGSKPWHVSVVVGRSTYTFTLTIYYLLT